MNKYNWSITAMFTLPEPIDKSVVRAEYLVIATNNDVLPITAIYEGIFQFTIPSNIENFIPYEKLTETEILNWIQSEPNLVTNIQANLDEQIESQIISPIVPKITPLPWATK
jgi:hypothetical protein